MGCQKRVYRSQFGKVPRADWRRAHRSPAKRRTLRRDYEAGEGAGIDRSAATSETVAIKMVVRFSLRAYASSRCGCRAGAYLLHFPRQEAHPRARRTHLE